MKAKKQESNILKFKQKKHLNIGIIVFGIIFIYLVVTVITFLASKDVASYEVRQGSLLTDYNCTGFAIRDEVVVYADAGGYINYYAPENSKVKVGAEIYTLSNQELTFNDIAEDTETALTSDEQYSIMLQIQKFNHDFQESSFSSCYYLESEIQNTLSSNSSQNRLDQLHAMINAGVLSGVTAFQTPIDGAVSYYVDGMEGITVETATLEQLEQSNYKKSQYNNNDKVSSGDPVYKIVTDDKWTLMVELTENIINFFCEGDSTEGSVKVKFIKDNQSMWADYEVKEVDERYVCYLTFQDSMIRYINERFVDVELILQDQTGLKIPKSAVTEKYFYIVPKDYITQGGDSSSDCVVKESIDQNGDKITALVSVDVYYDDGEIVYIDTEGFEDGDVIVKPEFLDTYQLSEKAALEGVYGINKGYAVFKQIHIMGESDSYYIVEEGNSYGLSNYDNIALDSSDIKENEILY